MSHSTKQILLSMMAVIFLLAACAPPQPTQTQEAVDIADEVATSVALTVAAQNTQTAAAIPPATNTTLPTQTEAVPPSPTAILPTATPLALPTVTRRPASGSPAPEPEYACDIIRRRPLDNEVFRPNADFEIRWVIINTGTRTMRAGLDLKYNSGDLMSSISRMELPELKPGDQHTVYLEAIAPRQEGHHIMTFIVEGGLCYPYAAIIVEP